MPNSPIARRAILNVREIEAAYKQHTSSMQAACRQQLLANSLKEKANVRLFGSSERITGV